MNRCIPFTMALLASLAFVPASAQSTMTVYLSGKYILSTDTRVIEVIDRNCNRNLGQFSLGGNQKIALTVCRNDSGYGNIQYRNVTNNGSWVGSSLLSEGEEVSP